MNFIAQDALNEAVLFQLFVHAQKTDKRLNKEEVAKLFSIQISPKRAELAIESLGVKGHVSTWIQSGSSTITSEGYREVENQLKKPGSFIRLYAEHGDDWLNSQTIHDGDVPASDRIVSRSDNQAQIEEIALKLDEIGNDLAVNNEIGSALGDDRGLLQSEIEASKVLVKSEKFRLAKLLSLLGPALKFLAEKFSGSAIGEAAKHLITLIFGL